MKFRHPLSRLLFGLLLSTLRIERRGDHHLNGLLNSGAPFVLVFWHGSMLVPWWVMRNRNACALVSMSRDGEILARLLASWGYEVLRGSSSRGGKEAMTAMRAVLESGRILCVTPDGPRGPAHEFKMGALRAAQTSGVPIICMAAHAAKSKVLRSWDRFEIPLPFTKVRVAFEAPQRIDPDLQGELLEQRRVETEKTLMALHRRVALEHFGA